MLPRSLTGRNVYARIGIMAEGQESQAIKPVFWIGNSLEQLQEFPDEVCSVMGFALWQAQNGRKHVDAKPLHGFGGAGVLEIVADRDGSTFRGVYTVKFAGAVYVLHAFQKKSKHGIRTPKAEIELIRTRLKQAEQHHKNWLRS